MPRVAPQDPHEMEDRQSRATNVILFNVPDSRAETVIARNGEDANITKQICMTLVQGLNMSR